jgi:hypothetical protein
MNFVESALYPVADPSVARPVGTVSDINYRMVYETVFFGNQRIPGLFSQTVRPPDDMDFTPGIARTPSADFGSAEIEINLNIQQWLDDFLKRSNRREDAREFNEAIAKASSEAIKGVGETPGAAKRAAESAYRVLRDELGFPLPTRGEFKNAFNSTVGRVFQNRRETQEFGTGIGPAEAQRMREEAAFRGEDVSTTAPTSPAQTSSIGVGSGGGGGRGVTSGTGTGTGVTGGQAGTPSTQPVSSQQRITQLANSLVPVIRYQDFRNIPYGRDPSEFVSVPSPKLEKARTDYDQMQTQYDAMDESQEKFDLGEQLGKLGAEILTMENNQSDSLYRPIEGRGPLIPLPAPSPLVVDYSRRRNIDPRRFTPELQRIFAANDALMQEPAPFGSGSGPLGQINETMLTEEQIASEMRELRRQNKLSDAYQRIASVRPGMNVDKISDINGIDNYGYQEFSAFVFDAQRMGMTYQQYLAQLENDPEQLSRAARTGGGGGGGGVTIRLPSDDDLTSVFKYVSQATIGRTLPKEVYQSMIDAYKPQLVRFQQQAAGGGTVTEPPQAETFAETQIEQQFGQEKFTYQLGGFLNELSKLAGGGM